MRSELTIVAPIERVDLYACVCKVSEVDEIENIELISDEDEHGNYTWSVTYLSLRNPSVINEKLMMYVYRVLEGYNIAPYIMK